MMNQDKVEANVIADLRKEVRGLKAQLDREGKLYFELEASHQILKRASDNHSTDEVSKGEVQWKRKAAHWEAEMNARLTASGRNYFNLDMEHQALKDNHTELQESYAQLEREALRPAQDYEEQRALASQRGQALRDANMQLEVQANGMSAMSDVIHSKQKNIEGLGKQAKKLRKKNAMLESLGTEVQTLARDRLDMLYQQEAALTKAVTEAARLRMLLTDSEFERSKLIELYDTQGRAAATYGHQAVTVVERMVVLEAERDGANDSARRLDREVDELKERLSKQVKANEDLEVRVKHWCGEVQTYKEHIKEGILVDSSVVDELNKEICELGIEVNKQKAKQAEVVKICDAQWRCDAMMGRRVQNPRGQSGIVVGYQICRTPEDEGMIECVVDVDIPDTEPSYHLRYWSIDKVTCL